MPRIRKADPAEAAQWVDEPPFDPAPALARYQALADRTGITRMVYVTCRDGWQARVYVRGVTLTKLFADSRYGGPDNALTAALGWREMMREQLVISRTPPQPRLSRSESRRLVGWLAYPRDGRPRRFFSDGKWGGNDGARQAAQAYLGG
jgi:hypothetical protein